MDTPPFHRARLHRFRDTVALSLPSMPTVYLSAALADALAGALAEYARDIRTRGFSESRIGTTDVETDVSENAEHS